VRCAPAPSRYIRGIRRRRAPPPIGFRAGSATFIVTWIALQGGEIGSVQLTVIKRVITGRDREPAALHALHGEYGR
jgi:hypothetical protein